MKVSELLEKTSLKLKSKLVDNEIDGVFVGDLLSFAMGNGHSKNIWVTMQAHNNVVAVALLAEYSCIIISENVKVEQDVIDLANEKGVCLIESKNSTYDTCKILNSLNI